MSLPSGIAAFTASGKTSARPYPTGRPRVGGCYPLGPSSRTSSSSLVSRAPRNGSGVLKTPPTRALSLGLTSERTFPTRSRRSRRSRYDPARVRCTHQTACEGVAFTRNWPPDSHRGRHSPEPGMDVPRPMNDDGLEMPARRPLGTLFRCFVRSFSRPARPPSKASAFPLQGKHVSHR